MRMNVKAIFIGILVITIFAYGLYVSPAYIPDNLEIDAEYFSAILTASGILYGVWILLLERKPEDETKRFLHDNLVKDLFLLPFILLIISVSLVILTAVDIMSPLMTLVVSAVSFFLNAFYVTVALYVFEVKR